jgi:hypothetical protein
MIDGIYAAYFSGGRGVSAAMFLFWDGRVAGADIGGMKYDGLYQIDEEAKDVSFAVKYYVNPGDNVISGPNELTEPTEVRLTFTVPLDFYEKDYVRIDTPFGPVNARFEKLRDLDR